MKTITRLAIALAAAAASLIAVSCSRFEYKDDLSSGGKVFHASFETVGAPDTKTYLDSEHKLLWTADDRLSIFEGNTYNQQYRYTGQTGETSADFEKVQTSGFHSGNDISSNYAVYPYLQENKIGNDGKMTIALPSVQQYAAGSFGVGANTMVAVTNGTSDTFLAFKNLCGYLVIKLYGEGTVKSISFKGNNGEKIAGSAAVTASYGSEPYVVMTNTATKEITLDCGSGVALGSTSQTATEFWFCIPPVTFSKGFSIKVTNTSGWAMEKSISSSRTISRNTINPMSALEVEFTEPPIPVPEMVDLGLSVKWASFNIGASKPEEYGDYYAWGETEPYYEVGYAQEDPQNHWKTGYGTDGYSFANYKWCNGSYKSLTKYNTQSEYGSVDHKTGLEQKDDVAHIKLGDEWRMPTYAEWNELIENCIWTWVTVNGVDGYKVTSNKSGYTDKWIFLPAAGCRISDDLYDVGSEGYFWSSSLHMGIKGVESPASFDAMIVNFFSDHVDMGNYVAPRYRGLSIRPVYGSFVEVVSMNLDRNSINLKWGEQEKLTATISPSMATNKKITWQSENASVATVNQDGVITANNDGNTTITAYAGNGTVSASCRVSISGTPQPEEFKAVDLGLSVKWSSCNLGADKSNEYGGYYQWAGLEDVTSTSIYLDWDNCPYHTGSSSDTGWTKYIPSDQASYWTGSGTPDNKTSLDPEDDVAHVKLGGKWRMSTKTDFEELINNCTWTWTQLNGVNGYKVKSKKPGYTDKYIFLPAAGRRYEDNLNGAGSGAHYWLSSNLGYADNAGTFFFNSDEVPNYFVLILRYYGQSVRPVSE